MRCGWLERVLSQDGTLHKEECRHRVIFFVLNVAVFVAILIITALGAKQNTVPVTLMVRCILACTSFVALILLLCKQPTDHLVLVTTAIYTLCIAFSDLSGRSYGEPGWAPFVLVVDYLLVMGVNERYTVGVVCVVVVWLIVVTFEQAFRFGLLDMPGLYPQDGEFGRREVFRKQVDCTDLPCPTGQMQSVLYVIPIFVIDFIATRGFARAILKEQATMERTINTVQEIASLLAGYDVERVAELLAEHEGQLPEEMTSALRSLEENLRKYKAYLPQTCLPFERDEGTLLENEEGEDDEFSEDDMQACSSSETVGSPRAHCQVQPLSLSSTKATLLTLNIKDTLLRLEKDSTCFAQLFSSVLISTLDATDVRRGMVDVFVGDRIHCSFNASKQCATHATSALHTATMLMQGSDEVRTHVNMGVATGKVLRGDMGCHVRMRRFSMVGALVRDVLAIERAGRVLGCDVLCNRLCFSDAECEHNLRLIPCKVELAANCEAEVLGELVVPTEVATAAEADEWMYLIGGKKDWDNYNQAVRGYLKGETSAEAVQSASLIGNCALYPVHVKAAPLGCAVFSFQGGGWGDAQ